jgi:tRNA pseudouridine38-40 synthase
VSEATRAAAEGAAGGADAAASVARLRLDLAYDGTAFAGWSRQPGLRTVQGTVERALATLLRREGAAPRLVVAGRTDAGVHATGQVAHLDVDELALLAVTRPRRGAADGGRASDPGAVLVRRLRGILGAADADVVVRAARSAPAGFDARFSAVWRRYEYRIADADAEHDPLQRHRTVWYPRSLDVESMDIAAQTLVGLGDFAAFCRPREGATTIRTLQSFRWRRSADGVLVASLQADAFCHSMVRALVGSGVAVGEGRLGVADPGELMHARARTSAFKVLPAKGLTLTEVGYPPEEELANRAEQTRARRELHVDGVVG